MKTIAARRLARRIAWGALLVPFATATACHHDWDRYDPLLGAATTAAGSGGGGAASSSSSAGVSSTSTTSASVGGSGGACTVAGPVEDCTEACDGAPHDHCGVWSVSFSGSDIQQGYALAVTPDAKMLAVVGRDNGTARFPTMQLSTTSGRQTFVVALQPTPTGASLLWGYDLGNYQETSFSVAIDPQNGVIAAGDFKYGLSPCPQYPLMDSGNGDMFVISYDASGKCRFAARFGEAAGADGANAVAADGSGIYVGGYFRGTVNFGDGSPVTSVGSSAAVLLKLVDQGSGVTSTPWKLTWDDTGNDEVEAVAVDPASGSVIAGGFYSSSTAVGTSMLRSNHLTSGVVAKLSEMSGAVTWARGFTALGMASAGSATVTSVAVEPGTGDVLAAGTFTGTFDFSGFTAAGTAGTPDAACVLTSKGSAQDIFVVRLGASDGHCIWTSRFGRDNASTTPTPRVAVNAAGCLVAGSGCVIVGATTRDDLYLGTWSALPAAGDDAALVALDADGAPVWARLFGDGNDQELGGLAVDGSGAMYITGSFDVGMAFSPSSKLAVTMTTMYPDAFVAKIAP